MQGGKFEIVKVGDLNPAEYNPRKITPEMMERLKKGIQEFGVVEPLVVNQDNTLIGGHMRLRAATELGIDEVPCFRVDVDKKREKALNLALNKLSGEWDYDKLTGLLGELEGLGDLDLELTGFDDAEVIELTELGDGLSDIDFDDGFEAPMFGESGGVGTSDSAPSTPGDEGDVVDSGALARRFLVAPFSVLDARRGPWQERKRQWIGLGIKSEVGREDELTWKTDGPEYIASRIAASGGGTSVFDPVLCELMYYWFSPQGGKVLDPFAGGSVRGVVAAMLGRNYTGIDLRKEQTDANAAQLKEIVGIKDKPAPKWIAGDSLKCQELVKDEYDFVFSCPPYADLEVYSDNPSDLSTMEYDDFKDTYFEIIQKSVEMLKDDRFACFVVGEIRDKKTGVYRNFVGDTIAAFEAAGAKYYNEIVLVTAIGSLPLRAGRIFAGGRKIGKTHQNILVFCKGNPKKAVEAMGEIEIDSSFLEGVAEEAA